MLALESACKASALKGLFVQEAGLDRNTELIKKMTEGKFTLRDM